MEGPGRRRRDESEGGLSRWKGGVGERAARRNGDKIHNTRLHHFKVSGVHHVRQFTDNASNNSRTSMESAQGVVVKNSSSIFWPFVFFAFFVLSLSKDSSSP